MEQEYEILTHLKENEITTQRKIAKHAGLSLGAVNLLLKKMIRKGLIKIERLNARTVRYILTPKGMQGKSRLACRYLKDSYNQILKINQILDQILDDQSLDPDDQTVILFGPADEISEILIQHLDQKNMAYEFFTNAEKLNESVIDKDCLILCWREDEALDLKKPFNTVNVVNML